MVKASDVFITNLSTTEVVGSYEGQALMVNTRTTVRVIDLTTVMVVVVAALAALGYAGYATQRWHTDRANAAVRIELSRIVTAMAACASRRPLPRSSDFWPTEWVENTTRKYEAFECANLSDLASPDYRIRWALGPEGGEVQLVVRGKLFKQRAILRTAGAWSMTIE